MAGPFRCVCGFDTGENTLHPDAAVVCAGCGQLLGILIHEPSGELTRDFPGPDPTAYELDPVGSAVGVSGLSNRVIVWPVVPGFEILGELGRGGMGIVYKARQTSLNRVVALKMILAGAHASDVDRERFRKEAAAVAALQHPGIVQIYEIGEHVGQPYLALEFVDGGSLAQKLQRRNELMPTRDCARLLETVARSMHHAHALGVVHRDLKPANVLLGGDPTPEKSPSGAGSPKSGTRVPEPTPKVTDFGLAKRLDETLGSGATKTGAVMGTPSYIAPEQAGGRGSRITPAADVYSLGAILYEMLTGRPPFKGDTPLDTVLQVIHDEPVAPSRLRPKLPRDLETICLKCLEKDPLHRYGSAEELADDLGRFQRRETIRARPQSSLVRGVKWSRRHPAISVFAITTFLAVVAVVAILSTAYADVREAVKQKEAEAKTARDALANAEEERARADRYADEVHALAGDLSHSLEASTLQTEQLKANEELQSRSVFALQLSKAAAICERDPQSALELLDSADRCPAELRDFAWRYLRRLCQREEWAYHAHDSAVVAAAASPDGTLIATADQTGTVRLWSPRTRITFAILDGRGAQVNAVAFSPDGDTVATAGDDGKVKLWAFPPTLLEVIRESSRLLVGVPTEWISQLPGGFAYRTLKPTTEIRAFRHRARCVAFAPNGRTLAAGGSDTGGESPDGVVRIYDLSGREVESDLGSVVSAAAAASRFLAARAPGPFHPPERRVLRDHLRPVVALAFSPDSSTLASGSEDASVQLTPMAGTARPTLLKLHAETVAALAWSPDGETLATVNNAADPYVWLWDLSGRAPKERGKLSGHTRSIYAVAFHPDGKSLASAGFDRIVRIWDVETGIERARLQGHTEPIRALAFATEPALLVSAGNDKTARIWRLAMKICDSGTLPAEVPVNAALAAISGDSRKLATVEKTGGVRLWRLDPKRRNADPLSGEFVGSRAEPRGLALSRDGRTVVLAADDGLFVWDIDRKFAGELKPRILVKGEAVFSVALAADGVTLAAATPAGVVIWDLRTGEKKTAEPIHTSPKARALAFAEGTDGPRRLAIAIDRDLTVIDLNTGERTTKTNAHVTGIAAVAFDRSGRTFASAGDAGRVKTWDVKSNEKGLELELRAELTGHTDTVAALRFSADGQSLVSAGQDRTAIIWDPVTGQERVRLTGHTDRILELGLTPSDGMLITIGRDGTLRRWRGGGE